MSYKVVHYINQFFANIGGEEMAHVAPELREGIVGPGLAFNQAWKGEAEIVKTVVCGDSYFAEHEADAKAQILDWTSSWLVLLSTLAVTATPAPPSAPLCRMSWAFPF